MPAVSKQQRKFMGLVHAVQQGKVPASKVSKSARDAAKQMKKKDVEDFASTDEKGLPKKKSESVDESGILYRAGVKKYGKEGMRKIQQAAGKRKSHAEIGKIKDKYEKDKKESVNESSYTQRSILDFIKANKSAVESDPANIPRIKLFGPKQDSKYLNISLVGLAKIAKIVKNESVDEGFGGELKGKDKEKFEKARKENAEVLGFKLTGITDIKESINEAVEPKGNMAKIFKIVKDKQHAKIGGMLVDTFSASALVKIFNAVKDSNKEKLNKMNMNKLSYVLSKAFKDKVVV